jgi:hypothetical protein
MTTKYTYTVDNQTVETLDLNTIPQGVEYTSADFIIEEEKESIKVPLEVPLWTMRSVLKQEFLFNTIIEEINNYEEPKRTTLLDFLEYGNSIERDSSVVLIIQQITKRTDSQIDNLFIKAEKLKL